MDFGVPRDGFWNTQLIHGNPQRPRGLELMDSSPARNEDSKTLRQLGNTDGCHGNSTASFNCAEREHMFDKVVTPSDVGKLNRLVIPKQHAEKYFPLDSSTNEKGLLLNFEDRNGKPWRFRYSYWNSSQSYVMTKGWSRFVKEKKLDAGDIVSFQRGVGDVGKGHLYIDWRRRPDIPELNSISHRHHNLTTFPHHLSFNQSIPWNPMLLRPQIGAAVTPFSTQRDQHLQWPHLNNINVVNMHHGYCSTHGTSRTGGSYGYGSVVNPSPGGDSVFYLRPGSRGVGHGAVLQGQEFGMVQEGSSGAEPNIHVFQSVPVVHGKASAKRLRLFGVNMECPMLKTTSDDCNVLSPQPSSPSSLHGLQLRLCTNGTPQLPINADDDDQFMNKGKSSMSLDFDI